MSWFTKTPVTDDRPPLEPHDFDVVDLRVRFKCGSGWYEKLFKSYVIKSSVYGNHPNYSNVIEVSADEPLARFMSQWEGRGYAIFDEHIVRFADFELADITRQVRTVSLMVRPWL